MVHFIHLHSLLHTLNTKLQLLLHQHNYQSTINTKEEKVKMSTFCITYNRLKNKQKRAIRKTNRLQHVY
ncbi:hypothetical protein AQUCO_07600079v1 [Aquilegia coerulea]|uniref:Uncharacterized protein n=1 Tax=Aquilegia coerulea TaxID=218851 RepID=A0A2G5C8S6_AQUCA|nr:hypothetical protein AQUCO_07600079v1 [Aquilegia coerulea]